ARVSRRGAGGGSGAPPGHHQRPRRGLSPAGGRHELRPHRHLRARGRRHALHRPRPPLGREGHAGPPRHGLRARLGRRRRPAGPGRREPHPAGERVMSDKIIPCIWYDLGQAKKAAEFYVSLGLPDSRIDRVVASPADNPSSPAGSELVVEFTLAGQRYVGLNGGPIFPQTEAVSFMIMTDDQAETDRLWDAIVGNGGAESACGWCKDRWGVNWQITPRRLMAFYDDP